MFVAQLYFFEILTLNCHSICLLLLTLQLSQLIVNSYTKNIMKGSPGNISEEETQCLVQRANNGQRWTQEQAFQLQIQQQNIRRNMESYPQQSETQLIYPKNKQTYSQEFKNKEQIIEQLWLQDTKIFLTLIKTNSKSSLVRVVTLNNENIYDFQIQDLLFQKTEAQMDILPSQYMSYSIEELKFSILNGIPSLQVINHCTKQSQVYKCYSFIEGDIIKKSKSLSYSAQMAILACETFSFIKSIKKETFYKDSKDSIGGRVFIHLKNRFEKLFPDTQSIINITKCFHATVPYQKKIFDQVRFRKGQTREDEISYFPTFATQEIFKIIIDQVSIQEKTVIYGTAGCGKSFAYSFYYYLFKFIETFRASYNWKAIHNFIDMKLVQYLPKIFYFSIGEQKNVSQFESDIKSQIFIPKIYQKVSSSNSLIGLINLIKRQYKKKGFKVVFLVDQINLYFSLLRNLSVCSEGFNKFNEQGCLIMSNQIYRKVHTIYLILQSLKDQYVIFSSSMNKEASKDIVKPSRKQFDWTSICNKIEKTFVISWTENCTKPYGLFQSLNYIKFQVKRLINRDKDKFVNHQAFRHYFDSRMKQFDIILNSTDLEREIERGMFSIVYFPLTLLKIREYLQQNKRYQNQFFKRTQINEVIFDLLHLLIDIKYESLSKIAEEFKAFIWKGDKEFKSRKIILFYSVLSQVRRSKNQFNEQKVIIQVNKILQNYMKAWNIDKQSLLKAFDRNFFSYCQDSGTLEVHLSPSDLIKILENAIFVFYQETNKILLLLLQTNFKKNGSFIGQLLDKCFARAVSQSQFQLIIENQVYNIKNFENKQFFFLDFSVEVQTFNKFGPEFYKQGSSILRLNEHYKSIFHHQNLYKLTQNEWMGAAPQTNKYYNVNKNLSSNSPSFDFILIRHIKKQDPRDQNKQMKFYEFLTFDLTVSDLSIEKILERFSKAKVIIDFIEQQSKLASYFIPITISHVLLTKESAKLRYDKEKQIREFQQAYLNKCRVESFQRINIRQNKSYFIVNLLITALQFTKQQLGNM